MYSGKIKNETSSHLILILVLIYLVRGDGAIGDGNLEVSEGVCMGLRLV